VRRIHLQAGAEAAEESWHIQASKPHMESLMTLIIENISTKSGHGLDQTINL
jgi:hypothetical protein